VAAAAPTLTEVAPSGPIEPPKVTTPSNRRPAAIWSVMLNFASKTAPKPARPYDGV
jgi:hypothetical protein